jgi:hypothetical protein
LDRVKRFRRKRERATMYVSKGGGNGNGGPVKLCKGLQEWTSSHPALVEYLTLASYPDGSERMVSTLLILAECGRIKVCLSDRDQSRSLWVTADTLEDALGQLEEDLQLGTADWRRSGGGTKRK